MKKKASTDAMEWIRSNTPDPRDVDDPTTKTSANLSDTPFLTGIHFRWIKIGIVWMMPWNGFGTTTRTLGM
jgi:hypothetical protein